MTLAASETCQLYARFSAQPNEVELEWVTWMLIARRDGRTFPLTIKFSRD